MLSSLEPHKKKAEAYGTSFSEALNHYQVIVNTW